MIAVLALAGLSGAVALAAVSPGTLYNVQITVSTESSLPDYFVVSAYNSTGALVTTSQSEYPAGTLQLPSGTYTLTAMASQQNNYYSASSGVAVPSSGAVASQGGASAPALCCVYSPPVTEYGYLVQQVSGPLSLTIPTKNINSTSTASVTIHASLPNGTAAMGASVSASVLGNWYWEYSATALSLYGTTDSSGSFTLVAPVAPLLVSVWASLPVNLPVNRTTVQQTIAGEKINVTVYWQPTYVSFGAWSLVTPPQSSASVVLHYQQPEYYVTPYSSSAGGAVSGAAAQAASSEVYPNFGPGGIAAPSGSLTSQATQTAYVTSEIGTATTTTTGSSNTAGNPLLYSAIGFGAALVAAVVVFAATSRRAPKST